MDLAVTRRARLQVLVDLRRGAVMSRLRRARTRIRTGLTVAEHLQLWRTCGLEAPLPRDQDGHPANATEMTTVDHDAVARLRDFADGWGEPKG